MISCHWAIVPRPGALGGRTPGPEAAYAAPLRATWRTSGSGSLVNCTWTLIGHPGCAATAARTHGSASAANVASTWLGQRGEQATARRTTPSGAVASRGNAHASDGTSALAPALAAERGAGERGMGAGAGV